MKHLNELTPSDKTRLLSEIGNIHYDRIDGWKLYETVPQRGSPDDLEEIVADFTSYDAIIPLVQKLPVGIQEDVLLYLVNLYDKMIMPSGIRFTDFTDWRQQTLIMFSTIPSQLCDAVLVATGKSERD
jgi:hypothetical protein